MLLRFKFQNFLSFYEVVDTDTGIRDGIEFSMIPGKVRLNPEHLIKNKRQNCLRFSSLFGANASGKSNLIKAIKFFQDMTKTGKPPIGYSDSYCKIRTENKDKPSYFEAEIIINDILYAYGFQVILSSNNITSEWLVKLNSNETETSIFYKDGQKESYHFEDLLKDNDTLKTYSRMRSNDTLLLSDLNNGKDGLYEQFPELSILKDIYNWITYDLEIIYPNTPPYEASFMINSTSLDKVAKLLYSFGTNIVKIEEVPIRGEKVLRELPHYISNEIIGKIEQFKKNTLNTSPITTPPLSFLIHTKKDIYGLEYNCDTGLKAYFVRFIHENTDSNVRFRIFEESEGTIRLFYLIEIILSGKNKTYVIDDFDQCLHPNLTYEFIKKFFELTSSKQVQLIITTHEQSLLDLDLLRRDEIWFCDKNNKGETSIYSLEEYNTRFDQRIDKAYLDGRYGATPQFKAYV